MTCLNLHSGTWNLIPLPDSDKDRYTYLLQAIIFRSISYKKTLYCFKAQKASSLICLDKKEYYENAARILPRYFQNIPEEGA